MTNERITLPPAEERELVRTLAQHVLEVRAPEELVLFDESADEFFADPERVLAAGGRDEAVGFGVELALLTPFVLAVVTPVVQLLVNMIGAAATKHGQRSVDDLVRRLLRRPSTDSSNADAEPPPVLSADQLALVRTVALDRSRTVGLPEDQAALLADAIVGGVAVAGTP